MPILVDENAPILFVHDTVHQEMPLTIFFNSSGQIVEAVLNRRTMNIEENKQLLMSILEECVFPSLAKVALPLPATPPTHADSVPPASPSPRANAVHTSTVDPPLNPAEALRREVAAEKQAQVAPKPEPQSTVAPTDEQVFHLSAICNRCPVACKVDISHTATGKFLGVTGNACDRGIGFAQNFLLEKFSEPLR